MTNNKNTITKLDIRNVMKAIPLISTDGCIQGFNNILPLGQWVNRCINHLTNTVREAIEVHEVNFPQVFSMNDKSIKLLTHKFEKNNEIFHLNEEHMAISYGPDPNCLLWLSNKKLNANMLPYAIEVPSVFIRKTKSGGLNGLDKVRQFSFPGIYILTKLSEAETSVLGFLEHATSVMNLIFGNTWKVKITTNQLFYKDNKEHFNAIEKTTGHAVELTLHSEQTRYFAYKLGLYADAIYDDLMIFNLQWDNTNANLFNIKINSDKDELMIIHATLAGAINRIYPALIANALASGICVFDPLVSPYHVGIAFNENNQNKFVIDLLFGLLEKSNIRHYTPKKTSFKNNVAMIDQLWIPYLIIVPADAQSLDDVKIFDRTKDKDRVSFSELERKLTSLPTTHPSLKHKQFELELPF